MNDLKPQAWFPLYFRDFMGDTGNLTASQHWYYMTLLGHQWYRGHFRLEEIPTITGASSEIIDSSSASSQLDVSQRVTRALQPIIELLRVDDRGLYFSPRLDRELSKAIENRRSHAERGRKGGLEKERRRQQRLSSPASSPALAGGVANGLAKTYPAPAPAPSKSKDSSPPPPQLASSAAGGLPPHPAPPLGEKPDPGGVADKSKQKAKGLDLALGRVAGASMGGRVPQTVVRGTTKVAAPALAASRFGKTGQRKSSADPRLVDFQAEVFKFWSGQNPKGHKCPWARPDWRALVEYLAGSPKAGLGHFKQLLKNRADSDINPSMPPRKWLRDLEEFASGPLDRFKKPTRGIRRL